MSSALGSVGGLLSFLGIILALLIVVYMALRLLQLGRWIWFIALLALGAFSFGFILLVFGLIAPHRPLRQVVSASKN